MSLIDAIARNEKVCHYLGSADPARQRYHVKADGQTRPQLRSSPFIGLLRTTLICGFPGETKEMHESLMQFINDMEFGDRLGAFTYSPEVREHLAGFPDQIDEETKKEWQADVMELQERSSSTRTRR